MSGWLHATGPINVDVVAQPGEHVEDGFEGGVVSVGERGGLFGRDDGSSVEQFGLWIADDDSVGLLLFGDSGIRGILMNGSTLALAWADDQYERSNRTLPPSSSEVGRHAPPCLGNGYS